MIPLNRVAGVAVPYLASNVDTDVIIRMDRLVERADLRKYAFEAIRYDASGEPVAGCVFNQPDYRDAPILLAGKNFGCGSSREGAVSALIALGIRVIVAPSFGDIFRANCVKNGVLPIAVPPATIEHLAARGELAVDLEAQTIRAKECPPIAFPIDALSRETLLGGFDDIELTLSRADAIARWQLEDRNRRPWIWLENARDRVGG